MIYTSPNCWTGLITEKSCFDFRHDQEFSLFHNVQSGARAHPAFCSVATRGFLPWGEDGWSMKNADHNLVPRLRISWSLIYFPHKPLGVHKNNFDILDRLIIPSPNNLRTGSMNTFHQRSGSQIFHAPSRKYFHSIFLIQLANFFHYLYFCTVHLVDSLIITQPTNALIVCHLF